MCICVRLAVPWASRVSVICCPLADLTGTGTSATPGLYVDVGIWVRVLSLIHALSPTYACIKVLSVTLKSLR